MATPEISLCSSLMNRPVRTRMPRWCGEGRLAAGPYPIRPSAQSLGWLLMLRKMMTTGFAVLVSGAALNVAGAAA